jgi:hypothetical protein
MKTIYLDKDFKCHVSDNCEMTVVETDFFDGKCDTFIEGYRFIPEGESWTRKDGKVFVGEMIMPFKDYQLLATAQSLYEEGLKNEDRITALEEENAMLMECILEMSEIIYA